MTTPDLREAALAGLAEVHGLVRMDDGYISFRCATAEEIVDAVLAVVVPAVRAQALREASARLRARVGTAGLRSHLAQHGLSVAVEDLEIWASASEEAGRLAELAQPVTEEKTDGQYE